MNDASSDNPFLDRARQAAKQNNLAAMHTYYAMFLVAQSDNGNVFEEWLKHSRAAARSPGKIVDVAPEGTFNRLMPAQTPAKVLEASLEKLKTNPLDLEAIHKIGKAAVAANWHSLAAAALADLLKLSPSLRSNSNKQRRELRMMLGKEHYCLKHYAEALAVLQEFQNEPSTPKEILQVLKDAAAAQASESFLKQNSAFNMATQQSVVLATKTIEEREQEEAASLQAVLDDTLADPAKWVAAALRLSEILSRTQQYDRALTLLAVVESRAGNTADLARKSVELSIRKRNDAIAALRQNPRADSRDAIAALELERNEYILLACAQLLRKVPTDGEVRLNLAEALYSKWKRTQDESILKEAITHFQFDFKSDEHAYRARLMSVEAFLALEMPGAAEVVLTEFLSRLDTRPESALRIEANYLLGVVREKQDDLKGAAAAYVAVISKNIRFKDTFERLRELETRRKVHAL
jgi:predicted negative regulator of RcsB-dependent stress response